MGLSFIYSFFIYLLFFLIDLSAYWRVLKYKTKMHVYSYTKLYIVLPLCIYEEERKKKTFAEN